MRRSTGYGFRKIMGMLRSAKARAGREEGQALIELAMSLSVLSLLLLGVITFGTALYDQLTLMNASNNAAQVVMTGAGVITDPCASANSAFAASASTLNNSKVYGSNPLSFSITAYTSSTASVTTGPDQVVFSGSGGPSCTSLASSLTQGQQVVVTATYGCYLTVFGYNFAPNCKLTAQTSEAVQ